jgi:hypothetical protein
MLETFGHDALRYIFIHELAHLKQRDIYLSWLMALLQVVHWFNPLMWFASRRMRADREMACDTLAISTMDPDEPPKYGRTIVSLLESFSQVRYLPSVAGILEEQCQIERRIEMIADYEKTSRSRWAGAMLLVVVLASIVLTNAYIAKGDFTFGTPIPLGSAVNDSGYESGPSPSFDGLSLYFSRDDFIWVSTRETKRDPWKQAVKLGPSVNSPNAGSPDISADGLSLFFQSTRSGGYGGSDLWITKRTSLEDEWEPPTNLGPVVNSSYDDWDPSISTDGLSLYFHSMRPGGFGYRNIWMATRPTKEDPWSSLVVLGPSVNGPSGAGWPEISPDGLSLFFASERSGRRDIYVATRESLEDDWSIAVNIGPPVSTSYQQGWPPLSADGSILYFVSNRPGSLGIADIWQVQILPILDLNGDGKVDMKDLRKMAQYWNQDESSCDIAPLPFGDGVVDDKDLMVFAEYLLKELQPIAYWKLDEDQGNVAYENVGDKYGTLHGNPTWKPTEGMVNGAIELDGIDDYISTPFILDPAAGSFSVFAWVKGGARGQMIISQKDTSDGRNAKLGCAWLWADPSYGRLMTRLMHPPFDPLVSEAVITDGQWHHVGLVYDFEALHRHLYADGKEVSKDTDLVGGVDSNGGLYFGASKTLDASAFWAGLIDDVRIYDEVLSAEEVADLAR